VLTNAVGNEDSEPEVVRVILKSLESFYGDGNTGFKSIANYRCRATTFKRKGIEFVAKAMHRTGLIRSKLMTYVATKAGTTALKLAVVRGDVEIVKILLEHGADPYVENDLGMNAFEICKKFGPFPIVNRVLRKHITVDSKYIPPLK